MNTRTISTTNKRILKHRERSNKFKLYLILFIFITTLSVIVIYKDKIFGNEQIDKTVSNKESDSKSIFKSTTKKEVVKKSKVYLVPVTNYTSELDNIDSKYLQSEKIYSLKEYEAFLSNDSNFILLDSLKELDTQIQSGSIALLLPNDVMPNYKSLDYEGANYWFKSDKPYNLYREIEENSEFIKDNKDKLEIKPIEVFATGELIPARAVDRLGFGIHENYTYVFDFFKDEIKNADLTMALLENSFLGDPVPCKGCVSFTGDEKFAKAIADVGYDMISTAGNHAGDAGQKGYPRTMELLDEYNISWSGTGSTADSEQNIAIKEVNGQRIGMFGADEVAYFYTIPLNSNKTTDSRYGLYSFTNRKDGGILEIDPAKIQALADLKKSKEIDFLVVIMSWGIEYTSKANSFQNKLARRLIDEAAVDLIVGAHPHWVQNIEFYKGKPIIYSLGNFIFDQTHTLPTRQGANAKIAILNNEVKSIKYMPHLTCGYHQTSNNLTAKYLAGEISMQEVYDTDDSKGCVYWQPRKLEKDHPSYKQIMDRILEHSTFESYFELQP